MSNHYDNSAWTKTLICKSWLMQILLYKDKKMENEDKTKLIVENHKVYSILNISNKVTCLVVIKLPSGAQQ